MSSKIELICGDSRNVLPEIIKSNEDRKIIIVSDPPYNINYHYKNYKDNMKENDYYNFMMNIFSMKPSVIIHYPEALYRIAFDLHKLPEKIVSWVYNSNTARQHRDIAFFGVKPDFNKVKQPYKNLNDRRIKKRIAEGKLGAKLYDWWNINQVKNVSKEKTKFPCQIPIKVMENIIGILPDNILVIDPFMGSGTTGIACKKLGVDFIGIDIDNDVVEIARKRIDSI